MADDDAKTKGNPGMTFGREAVNAARLNGILKPPFKSPEDGTDWNDYLNSLKKGGETNV